MVTADPFEAFDLLIWLGNGSHASALAHCNQSTLSRRVRQLQASLNLLRLEWHLHQRSRFRGRQPLRLQAPCRNGRPAVTPDLPASTCSLQPSPPEAVHPRLLCPPFPALWGPQRGGTPRYRSGLFRQ